MTRVRYGHALYLTFSLAAILIAAAQIPRSAGAQSPASARDTLTAAFDSDFQTLDPAIGYDPFSWTGEHAIFNGLLTYRSAPGRAGTQLVPDLAASLPAISNGGRLYSFQIRHGVRFAPPVNREVISSDFKYSVERALAKGTAGAMYQSPFWSSLTGVKSFWAGRAHHISGIQLSGRYGIRFQLDSPNIAFENILAMPFTSVVPREWVQRQGRRWAVNPVGTGPYRLNFWHRGTTMLLDSNPNYFVKGYPRIPHVFIQFNIDDHLQILRAQKGQLDLPGNLVQGTDYLALRTGPDSKQLVSSPDIAVYYLSLNTQMSPFKNNLRLRRALNMAINKSHILRLINRRGIAMNGILPPTMPGANPAFTAYGFSPAAARAQLQAAGYKPGQLHLTLLLRNQSDDQRVADAVQADLSNIGVSVTLKPVSTSTFYGSYVYNAGKSNFTLSSWGQDYPDPSDFVDPILTCGASSNAAFYCNRAVDQLANRARGNTNRSRRYAQYRQIERMIMNDAPWVPLFDDILYDFHGSRVRGFYIHPVWPFNYHEYRLTS